jgi:cell division septum initiation protein DivIVA
VSAFEPQQLTGSKVDLPDFMVVLRGFDRRQVEVWAKEVAAQIDQERQRGDEAEKRLYRLEMEKGAPSFTSLGTHVAGIIEEAGRSAENMLADAADRAQEAIDAAEEEAGEIIKAAEHRAGEIEQAARQAADEHRAEGVRVEEEARAASEAMRAQAEHDARTVLEEARDATDLIWQEAERERVAVESEAIRLETLRHRSLEQLGRMYGHLESVLDEVRAGIGRVDEDNVDEGRLAATRPGTPAPAAAAGGAEPAATGGAEQPALLPAAASGASATAATPPAPATPKATPTTQQAPAAASPGTAGAGSGENGPARDADTTQRLEQDGGKHEAGRQDAGTAAKEPRDQA